MAALTEAIAEHSTHIHMLWQSYGGFVGDAVALYNFFQSLPVELTLYNTGTVRSAAVTAYLGAKIRLTTADATFMIHRCTYHDPKLTGTAAQFRAIADSLVKEEAITKEILKRNITLDDGRWDGLEDGALYFSATEAIAAGIATGEGYFSPPPNTKIKVL